MVSNSSGDITASNTNSTQLEYLDNVVGDLQNQIDSKQDTLVWAFGILTDLTTCNGTSTVTHDIHGTAYKNTRHDVAFPANIHKCSIGLCQPEHRQQQWLL